MRTTAIQAQRADTASAGGVSHREKFSSRHKGPEGRHNLREDRGIDLCRPSGPLVFFMAIPGPDAPGRGCVGPLGLNRSGSHYSTLPNKNPNPQRYARG